ncbi:hypothetical protein FJQ98_15890 [Lysinibacillus agricola]|uniref:Uncharacterized protein n=1 Tax=Lysinibacillus agricola TaxID=2590012 RepID=A0ABX7ALF4_9BACI|nr:MULTISPECIES: hypothetical protein [Lysinibacillus]KOS61570.1 hypothetical protein AN161_18460 [Lysinibacillus sp. FJAT-14222]QQP10726.1 hypothetical protein FJQ98_15890 [Lysinibacillus agricola]
MKNFLMNVMDLKVFDEKGKFITKLDTATKGELVHSDQASYFAINISDFNIDMIKAIGEVENTESLSDFEKELAPKSTKIKFKPLYRNENEKKFKLVAEGELYNSSGDVSHDFKVIINESVLMSGLEFEFSNVDISEYTHVFAIRVDDNGNSFELELIEK